MARIVYSFSISLDGFVETLDRSLDWVRADEEYLRFVIGRQASVGAYLYGRGLYENMAAYWPTPQASDPANPEYVREWAHIWLAMPKIVFSKTLENVAWNSRLIRDDAAQGVKRLKAQPGKDLAVGGATIAASLIREDLVDVYEIFVQPVVLGQGTPYFPSLDGRLDLRLIESGTFESGVVRLRYERTR